MQRRANVSPRTFFLVVLYAVLVTAAALVHVVLHYLPPKPTSIEDAQGPLNVVRHPDGTASIELDKGQVDGCDANHGCSLFPNDALESKLDELCSEPAEPAPSDGKGHFDGQIFRKGESGGSV